MRLAILMTLVLAGAAAAHDGHEQEDSEAPHLIRSVRTWTDASGTFHVHGSFVAARDDSMQIRKTDGTLLDLKRSALSRDDEEWVGNRLEEIARLNNEPAAVVLATQRPVEAAEAPAIVEAFRPFEETLSLRWDDRYLYVGSDGMPDHPLMIGITAWQQQVPLPQRYTGDNAWRIPLRPAPAKEPMSAKENFFRGAIALAINGVPIFNPIKNDGRTDTFLAGELDEYGGHCARADDYHYHIAPVHLEPRSGKGKPLAYALDGYQIYGYDEPDGSKAGTLDRFNGHEDDQNGYHYHATRAYPYLNGGFHGEVTERDGQVDPQPRAEGVRPALPPLRGATITGFRQEKPDAYRLTYTQRDGEHHVDYQIAGDGSVRFDFVEPSGAKKTETYQAPGSARGPQDRPGGGGRNEPPPQEKGQRGPRPGGDQPRPGGGDEAGRRPWMQVHASEMDANQDGALERAELSAEVDRVFAGYDGDRDGKITREEYERPGGVRSAMGGFVRQHAQEIDRDANGSLTREELMATATRMFDRADSNGDGSLSGDELGPAAEAPPRQDPPARGGRERSKVQGRATPERPRAAGNNEQQTSRNELPPFHAEVPAHPVDVILRRPTGRSVVLSICSYNEAEGYVAYGASPDDLSSRSDSVQLSAGVPTEVALDGLKADTRYHYRLHRKTAGEGAFEPDLAGSFQTQRPVDSAFTFTVQADSHLDQGMRPELYLRMLANASADRPDFHIDLGDTFMTEKHDNRDTAARQYLAQRYYFGQLAHATPLFLVLGNHDGESPRGRDDASDSLAVWSNGMRKRFFPNPVPDAFYTGNETRHSQAGLLQDYYAWEWGDALFVVLDPFWHTRSARGQSDNWNRSLGAEQYQWLERTLTNSKATFKFLFIHHLVGGATREGRGGAEAAPFFEWDGKNLDGSDGFAANRPDWRAPIHQLLVENHVTAVFHGHDHLYVKQDLDGIVYQEVPQPGNSGKNAARNAAEYGYKSGVILGSPGHLRVRVAPTGATIAYVRACLTEDEQSGRFNAAVEHSYVIPAQASPAR